MITVLLGRPYTRSVIGPACFTFAFLQRGRIACNEERCNTYSNSVCPSVWPSVIGWYPIQMNEHKITRSLLWGSKNTLVFWYQQCLGGDVPFHLKFALKVTHPLWNAPTSTPISAYNISTVKASKKVELSWIGSRPRAFQRATDEVRTLLLSPQRVAQNEWTFVVLLPSIECF